MSLFMSFTALSNQCGCRSVGLALGERANPKVECLNATEGSGYWEMPVMKVDSVSGCTNTLDYCTGNR